MYEGSEVTTVVEDHVQRLAAREGSESLFDAPLVFLFSLTLPGKDGDAGSSDAGKVILNECNDQIDQMISYAAAAWS